MSLDILAAQEWADNGAMMVDVAELHLDKRMKSMDVTYGEGVWWKHWRPSKFTFHDIEQDGVDFRKLPHRDGSFDLIAYDPPYISPGGRKTSTIKKFNAQYGLAPVPKTPKLLQAYINDGLDEVWRCLRGRETSQFGGGIALVKCMNYVSSGKLFLGYKDTLDHALELGFEVLDIFYFVGDARPQPSHRWVNCKTCKGLGWVHDIEEEETRMLFEQEPVDVWMPCGPCGQTGKIYTETEQVHARTNVSFLFVLRKR